MINFDKYADAVLVDCGGCGGITSRWLGTGAIEERWPATGGGRTVRAAGSG